jgi:hypothetical protein
MVETNFEVLYLKTQGTKKGVFRELIPELELRERVVSILAEAGGPFSTV